MSGSEKLLVVVGLFLALSSAPVEAQPAAVDFGQDLSGELAGVNRSLARVATVLEQLLENQKTDIILKRIEMRERRVAPLETALRKRRDEVALSRAELDRLESLKQNWDEGYEGLREAARTDENAANELRHMQAEFERAHASQSSRHQALEENVRTLEDELAEGRELIQDLEALLLERIAPGP